MKFYLNNKIPLNLILQIYIEALLKNDFDMIKFILMFFSIDYIKLNDLIRFSNVCQIGQLLKERTCDGLIGFCISF